MLDRASVGILCLKKSYKQLPLTYLALAPANSETFTNKR